jgi:1-acyl-sn-glycerol-3-phosphate acyltransferase
MRKVVEGLGFLRTLFFTLPLIYLSTVALGVVVEAVAPFDRDRQQQHRLARLWARVLLACGLVRVRVRGWEHLAPGRHYVYVANHQSYADVPVLLACLPPGVRFMAKASLFAIPFTGWYMRRAGHLPIDIDANNVQANARRLLQAVRSLRQGHSLVVFPEGGRSRSGALEEFKAGIFLAAVKVGVPVMPVTIAGTKRVLAMDSWVIHPGRVELVLDDPVPTEGMGKAQLDGLVRQVRQRMEQNLREASP